MKTAVYPGSFDPITSGHLNIIRRAANIFDKLIVCVMVNSGKNPMFTLEERVELIQRISADIKKLPIDESLPMGSAGVLQILQELNHEQSSPIPIATPRTLLVIARLAIASPALFRAYL